MMTINIASEDEISEAVAKKLVSLTVSKDRVGLCLRKGGNSYLKSRYQNFCRMAKREYVLLLTDLDRQTCAPSLISSWSGGLPVPERLLFRVAVREVEAWLLADREGLATMMGVDPAGLPPEPEQLPDPKRALLQAARGAKREIRTELLSQRGSLASQGFGYNRVLVDFVESNWSIERARERAPSLDRAIRRLAALT